jgi:hypothetical protein
MQKGQQKKKKRVHEKKTFFSGGGGFFTDIYFFPFCGALKSKCSLVPYLGMTAGNETAY